MNKENNTVIYIHGQGGNAKEADHYRPLFRGCNVTGFDYSAQFPWEAEKEFPEFVDSVREESGKVILIANSMGAYFAMSSLSESRIKTAYFISPVVDMEKLIEDMMLSAGINEKELSDRRLISLPSGQTLSWEYLCYARKHPVRWNVPTHILYGSCDNITSQKTISCFAEKTGATLTIMKNGEHWFHTGKQMNFLDNWINSCRNAENHAY